MNFNHIAILLLALISETSTYLLSPALPIIARAFATSENISQLIVSLNMFGITIATIVYGPLSDNWGRKKALLNGLVIFTSASGLCFLTQSLNLLIFLRFFQGIGEGAMMVVGYAVIRDMYDEIKRARAISQFNFVSSTSLLIAPIAGGAIATYFNWKGIFLASCSFGILFTLLVKFYFKETFHPQKGSRTTVKSALLQYWTVLKQPNFIIYTLIDSLPSIEFWGILSSLPFIFTNLGVEAHHYGFYALTYSLVYIIGVILNQFLLGRVKRVNTLIMAGALIGVFDIIPLVWNYISPLSPLLIVFLWTPNSLGLALIVGNGATKALEAAGEKNAGAGAALIIFFYTILGTLGSYFIGKFYEGQITLLFWVTLSISIIIIALLLIVERNRTAPARA